MRMTKCIPLQERARVSEIGVHMMAGNVPATGRGLHDTEHFERNASAVDTAAPLLACDARVLRGACENVEGINEGGGG